MPIRFAYNNLWRKGTIYKRSDQHPQYPWEDTQLDTPSQFSRSRYGIGSGNGTFIVGPGTYFGPNLVTNGEFSINADGWLAQNCGLEIVAGGEAGNCLSIIRTEGAFQYARQPITGLTIGSFYFAQLYVKSGSSGNEAGFLQFFDGTDYYIKNFTSSGTWTIYTIVFKATTTTGNLYLVKNSATPGTMLFDTVIMGLYSGGERYINFDEGGAELEGLIVIGTYDGNTLATAIAAAMNAAPGKALTYVCTYNETTAKFTISAGSNFTLRLKTGSKMGCDFSYLCGFLDTADLSGASTYTAPFSRIHSVVYVDCDFGTLNDINFIAIINHNISSIAMVYLILSTTSDFLSNNTTISIAYNAGSIFKFFTTANKRYGRLHIEDPTNPNLYIQIGPVWTAKYFELSRQSGLGPQAVTFLEEGYEDGGDDPSDVEFSSAGVLYAQERPFVDGVNLAFKQIDVTSKSQVRALIEEVGLTRSLIAVFDYTQPNTSSMLARLESIVYPAYGGNNCWDWSCSLKEMI